MEPIIVTTNFSKLSDNAVLYAASLAKHFNRKLIMFNAFQIPLHASNTLLSIKSINNMMQNSVATLEKLAKSLKEEFEIEVDYECGYFELENKVDVLMKKYNASLLVMGMSDKSLEQNLIGNPTTTLISMKKFPVLAVPIHAKFKGIRKILFACDLMKDVPLKTLARLRQIANGLDSKVTVFYVDEKIDELKLNAKTISNIDNELNDVTYLYKNVKSDAIIEEIHSQIQESDSELLVMIPKAYGFWESLIHKSKTRVMASGLNIPLLSIPVK
ncbi:universal stress protein, UspA family [Formosa agariphila KMM 3901]|uniref:Universal stress protein, UspA family n=1 Tax=Formosa agariphila (strain DSM 15362 / KCTC 12365 / LMG 23005 / KMM 3901 / M-2Alg 35-1) TaxID=1347342 RepID=T2KHN0_FORAG|nr:universal stress protein [Formosa agariphila]CDF78352.1 universal stress protein, UspA family [Formosa agariphila KMM 3901]